ncbi:MAG: Dipicolinate synthase subunit A [Eubacteriales bacterium SKADARSKE-1]|nr:Dipicolinate synthase subunit A [Eubacteriales bacterium SKADARSKE-1]
MTNAMSFGILGGDKRQIALANSICLDGHNVCVSGFDKYQDDLKVKNIDIDTLVLKSDYILLPIPVSRDGVSLNSPFCDQEIKIDKNFVNKLKDKIVFCAMKDDLIKICESFKFCNLYDYAKREDFANGNAIPTAEGAIEIALKEHGETINGASCLVCGFGRIGKVLTPMLKGLGANVCVSARKLNDILLIKELKCNAVLTSDIRKTSGYDLIFNTVPHLIFDYETLKNSAKGSIIIDLASMPGGADDESAESLNIKVIHALGLPGKFAPKTAGEIIKNTIYNMIKEEGL